MPLRCCTYLRVSRIEQNNGVALERMRYAAEKAATSIGGVLEDRDVFTDLISGRKNDRPDFKGVWGLIERKEVDVVIFYRVDRLGRDAELLLKLRKLFESTGVKAYVCQLNKILDWESLEDRNYWIRAAMSAEMESDVIRDRLLKAHDFNRHKKQAAFVAPFGYRRNENRLYEFDPDEVQIARRMIEILEEEDGRLSRTIRRIYLELDTKKTSRGFVYWINNPVLRGHTPYGRNKHGKAPHTVEYNTHSGFDVTTGDYNPSLDYRLLTEDRYLSVLRMIESRKTYTGKNANKDPYPLTGLTECVCGATCTVMKSTKQNKNGTTRIHTYLRCRAGDQRYSDLVPHKGSARYDVIEDSVIGYLISKANLLVESLSSGLPSEERLPDPEILNKLAQIEYVRKGVEQFGDPTGRQAELIAELQLDIAKLEKVPNEQASSQELRDRLTGLADIEKWQNFSTKELRRLFVTFVRKVVIDFELGSIDVLLNPLLRL